MDISPLQRLSDYIHDLVITDDSSLSSFDQWRRVVGMILGPLLALVILALPFPGLSSEEHRLAAVTVLIVTFWVTEAVPLPVGAMLAVCLIVIAGISPAADVLAAFGDQVIFLFIGSFMLAQVMQVHGVDRRIAYALLAHPWVGGSTYRTIWAVGLTAWALSMWVSNTATVAMLLPVVLAIARSTGDLIDREEATTDAPRRYTTGLLLMLAYAGSIGGIATPVGTPPNLIGIALIDDATGERIDFIAWMTFALPLATVLLLVAFGIVMLRFRPRLRHVPEQLEIMRDASEGLGPWTAGQRNSLIAFLIAVTLWLVPGIASLLFGPDAGITETLQERLPEGIVALLAATLLFMLPVDLRRRRFTATWEEAVRIDWGTVILFGGGIALGRAMLQTGLAGSIGTSIISATGARTEPALAGLSIVVTSLLSEIASNTASVNIVLPVILSATETLPVSTLAVGVAATLGASMGFMLPVSTPPNAIVYGSGELRITDMVTTGVMLDVLGILTVWLTSLWLIPTMLDLAL